MDLARWSVFLALLSSSTLVASQARNYSDHLYTVCVNPWEPFVTCTKDETSGASEVTGLDIQEITKVFDKMNWVRKGDPGADGAERTYQFRCTALEDMLGDLAKEEGECHMGTALTVTKKRLDNNITMSYPTFRGSLAVLSLSTVRIGDGWGFIYPITPAVWALVLVTGLLLIPVLLVVFEFFSERKRLPGSFREVRSDLAAATWNSFATLLQVGDSHVRTVEARIVMVGYAFFVLVVISVYTANMTANMTIRRINAGVTSSKQLSTLTVGSLDIFVDRLKGYGVLDPQVIPADENTMAKSLEMLREKKLDAVIMAAPWVRAVMIREGCKNLYSFELDMEPYDYSIPFPRTVDVETLHQMNRAIMELSETQEIVGLQSQFAGERQSCVDTTEGIIRKLGISQMYGLWVIMGACIVLAFMLSIMRCCIRRYSSRLVRMDYIMYDSEEEGDVEQGQVIENPLGSMNGNSATVLNRVTEELRGMRDEIRIIQRRVGAEPPVNLEV